MGWLEVLALLKRMLPLLTRVAPMLESFIASRSGTRAEIDGEFQRVAGDIRAQLTATADQHGSVAELLAVQGAQLAAMAKSVEALRADNGRTFARLLETETAAAAQVRVMHRIVILLVTLLIVCVAIMAVLLRHMR